MDRLTIDALKGFRKYLEEESNRETSSDFMDGVKAGYIDALDEFKRALEKCSGGDEWDEITGEGEYE